MTLGEPAAKAVDAPTSLELVEVRKPAGSNDSRRPSDSATRGYLAYLRALADAWSCPPVEITYRDLAFRIRDAATIADAATLHARQERAAHTGSTVASKKEEHIPNNAKAAWRIAMLPVDIVKSVAEAIHPAPVDPATVLTALQPASGVIRPGSMTLILAPPGAGKSTFLRALAGRLSAAKGISGEVRFNGLTPAECLVRDIHVSRMCAYVGQGDVSFPSLSVTETLEFARQNGVADVRLLRAQEDRPNVELEEMDARRTQLLMELLGLTECKDTMIGSDMVRGISGGQRKRVQIGEALMSNARLYCLDEISNGLDSNVTLSIFTALKQACTLDRSSVVTALQQVTPETYALFDDVILLREGHILYHGPRSEVSAWLREVLRVPGVPPDVEEAGFLIELLSDAKAALEKASAGWRAAKRRERGEQTEQLKMPAVSETVESKEEESSDSGSDAEPQRVVFHVGPIDDAARAASSPADADPFVLPAAQLEELQHIDQLSTRCRASRFHSLVAAEVSASLAAGPERAAKYMAPRAWSAYTRRQYARQFPHSLPHHTALCIRREAKLMWRNEAMIVPRLSSAFLTGLIYGLLFYQLSDDDFATKMGLIQNAIMFAAFQSFQELPVSAEGKQVVLRQVDAGWFPAVSYTMAVNFCSVPLNIAEVVIYGVLQYWISAFNADGPRFLFFLFLLFCIASAMSQLFRFITYASRSADVAEQMSMPFIMVSIVFGGFLIPRNKVSDGLIWLYYASPFSWAANSLAVNEFSAPEYDAIEDPATDPDRTLGDSYLEAYGLHTDRIWMWMAVVFLWGWYFLFSFIIAWFMSTTRPTVPLGAKRALSSLKAKLSSPTPADVAGVVARDAVVVEVEQAHRLAAARSNAKASFQLAALPFTPATLAWKDLRYTVYVGKEKTPKVLLDGISGYAAPGQLTALMGASGAGKTTLLDVLGNRKTTGLIEHESNIFVNGRQKDATFERITAYCEQQDLHVPTATVREALDFSAYIRLPASVDQATRDAFVTEVLDLVGLTAIQNRMVGDADSPSLSSGQLKLLTIAVELVANPSILFLDEPTTGLDAKSAYRVMRAIKRIAATNRTIICTIHQPSFEVFSMFDRLLLLRRGGRTVFFDDLGTGGQTLVSYLSRVSRNLLPRSPSLSPQNWMLDLLALDVSVVQEEHRAEQEARKTQAQAAKVASTDAAAASAAGADQAESTAAAAAAPVVPDESVALQAAFRSRLLQARQSSGASSAASPPVPALEQAVPVDFAAEWAASGEQARAMEVVARLARPAPKEEAGAGAAKNEPVEYISSWARLVAVVRRLHVGHWRSPAINVTRCVLMVVIGLFLGLVYYDLRVFDFSGLSSLLSAVFLGVTIPASICSSASLSYFFRLRAIFHRENSAKMYSVMTHTLAMSLAEAPYTFVAYMLYIVPFYFLTGLIDDAQIFWKFFLAGYLLIQFFAFQDQIELAWLPNLIAAQAFNGLMMSLLFAFGGLFIKASSIPIGWKWFYYIDPIPKVFIAGMLTQLDCPDGSPASTSDARIDGCRAIEIPGQSGTTQVYSFVADFLDSSADMYWPMIGWMLLTLFIMRCISIILFRTISHLKR